MQFLKDRTPDTQQICIYISLFTAETGDPYLYCWVLTKDYSARLGGKLTQNLHKWLLSCLDLGYYEISTTKPSKAPKNG